MHSDILRDTWAFKEIFHEGKVVGEQPGKVLGKQEGEIQTWQQAVLDMVRLRFPDLVQMAEAMVANCSDTEKLQKAVIKISKVSTSNEATDVLVSLLKKTK